MKKLLFTIFTLVLSANMGFALNVEVRVPGYHPGTVDLTPISGPTPIPTKTPTPTVTPPPPPGCIFQGTLSAPLGRDQYGVRNVQISNGQKFCYRAELKQPSRRVKIEISKQCLGANFVMDVIPQQPDLPARFDQTRSVIYGSLVQPVGAVQPQSFLIEVEGRQVGTNCAGNRSLYHLTWSHE